ncbi:MAG: efflux RND transporter permease subunit [Pseudomonadota bacterium]
MLKSLFYRAPRLTILFVLIAVAGGVGAITGLGRQEDPTLVERFGYVLTTFPGADAERIEALVTEPLESSLLELKEVEELDSTSRANVSQIQIVIRDDLPETEVDEAWTLIRQQVELARPSLPDGVGSSRVVRQFVGAATLVASLSWEGEGEPPLAILSRLAEDLEDRFRTLPGTEETNTFGDIEEEIRVVVDPEKLAGHNLSSVLPGTIM